MAEEIKKVDIVAEMKDSYLDYAMSVIVARALPDVRDGLKPVNRRILYAMHELGLTSSAKFRKSAAVVGDVLGKYHPHGDSACYDALVRMAQDFNMLHPLVLGQGNFGSVDGDPPAAMRYTEVKMSPLAGELLRDIEKETVGFVPNYDGSRQEPNVLPAAVPNLLVNGTVGIAVGMATRILPHNLGEVMDALIYLVEHPQAATEDLLQFVQGPDFPTGGIVFNQQDIQHASATGRGGVVVRGEAEALETKGGTQIVITSLPYQVNKAELVVKIAELVRDKKIEGVKDIREESTTLEQTRIVLELKSAAFPKKIINVLYKNTELETVFHYNMLALVDGVPKLLSLKDHLQEFIRHRETIITRRSRFDLARAEERAHILVGLKRAIDVIDEVIAVIRRSRDPAEAGVNLIRRFKFSPAQTEAILEMKLQRLANLEIKKIVDELKEKRALIGELEALLADPRKIRRVIKEESAALKEKYAVPRKTKVVKQGVREIRPEDLVPETENVLVLTAGGYIKRTDPAEYRLQRRGGVGVVDLDIKEEDFVTIFLTANTHSALLFFTNRGKVYQLPMYELPEGKRATRGKSVMNFLPLGGNEQITSVLAVPKETRRKADLAVAMVTRRGIIKKVALNEFRDVRKSGIIAVKLSAGDALLAALLVERGDQLILASAAGQAIRFSSGDVRQMGRAAAGVRAIRLNRDDEVVGVDAVPQAAAARLAVGQAGVYLVFTAGGFGKKTKLKEYKVQRRGGAGIKTVKLTNRSGKLIGGQVIADGEVEMIAVSKHGQVIRTAVSEIPTLGRVTQGVRVMKLRPGDSLASLTFL